jgi:hypothetical protein
LSPALSTASLSVLPFSFRLFAVWALDLPSPVRSVSMQDFMNGVCTNILHMSRKKITSYAGNYDTFVTAREQMEEQQMKKYNWEQEQVC